MKEQWKPIKGYEDYAEISNYGQIHRFERVIYFGKNHQIKRIQEEQFTYGSETPKGYLYATIGGKSFRVNRLVYITFVGDIPDGMEVNHIDEDKHNNRLDNLNLMTPKENTRWGTGIERRAAAMRGRKHSKEAKKKMSAAKRGKKLSPEHVAKVAAALRGKYNTKCSKAIQALDPITLEVVMEFPSAAEAGRQGFFASAVSECCNGNRKSHKGFIWRFKE